MCKNLQTNPTPSPTPQQGRLATSRPRKLRCVWGGSDQDDDDNERDSHKKKERKEGRNETEKERNENRILRLAHFCHFRSIAEKKIHYFQKSPRKMCKRSDKHLLKIKLRTERVSARY